jgi:hypothetical protein
MAEADLEVAIVQDVDLVGNDGQSRAVFLAEQIDQDGPNQRSASK